MIRLRLCRRVCHRAGSPRAVERRNRSPRCLPETKPRAPCRAERIREAVRTRNGRMVWAAAEAYAHDLGRKTQWDKWARECSDVEYVSIAKVDVDAVRISLTNQVVDAYLRRTGIQIGPLRRNIAAAAIANPVVEKLISPEALSQLLTVGWPVTVVPDGPPPATIGITANTIGTIWQIYANSEYGFGRFEVAGPAALRHQLRFRIEFRLLHWLWRSFGVSFPE